MYEIVVVPPDAAEAPEQMGTKRKFWFQHPDLGLCLFKLARDGTGEDWSEKVACELAGLLGLPRARYEMAVWKEQPGSVSVSMLSEGDSLIHGNELIAELTAEYPRPQLAPRFRNTGHTLPLVIQTIEQSGAQPPPAADLPAGVDTAVDVFVGYLMFDALVGNTDRHHENWAVIKRVSFEAQGPVSELRLSPTYDHASCLGRNETDARRAERLLTKDKGNTVEAYAERSASALYLTATDPKPLRTLDAFRQASEIAPGAAEAWKERLRTLREAEITRVLSEVPRERFSPVAVDFATRILIHNRARILDDQE
jgi:hypothetical protein